MKKIVHVVLKVALGSTMVMLYGAVLFRASEVHLESPQVEDRLGELSRCDQPQLARAHHHGAGACFRWERTRLLTGDGRRCVEPDTAVADLPRCQLARRKIAELGAVAPEQVAEARRWFSTWEEAHERARHDAPEGVEHREAIRATAGPLERADWAVHDAYFAMESLWVNLASAPTRPTVGDIGAAATTGSTTLDPVAREKLRVYWEATQVPSECLLP